MGCRFPLRLLHRKNSYPDSSLDVFNFFANAALSGVLWLVSFILSMMRSAKTTIGLIQNKKVINAEKGIGLTYE
jgi:formate hydrogenlyase subunit 4